MTTNENNKKKSNKARKLVPAAGMLAISAAMLASSTYAWFTMSREVEVKNIQMTATVPEDIQISLGLLYTGGNNSKEAENANDASLANSTGVLHGTNSGNADNAYASAPENDWDWSNTADISAYYQIGKLIPASSTTGASIFFTPDADGVGKTVKSDAQYIQANTSGTYGVGATQNGSGADTSRTYNATLHAFTAAEKSDNATATWTDFVSGSNPDGYKQSTGWNTTNDDGYFADIPVWVRTSSKEGAELSVQAYVIPKNLETANNSAGEALYRAVRVAILDPGSQEEGSSVTASNLLPVADGMSAMGSSGTSGTVSETPFAGSSILDWYSSGTKMAVDTAGTLNNQRFDDTIYSASTEYNANDTVAVLAAGQGTEYGNPVKMIIRVWLEGEDPDCWNETAGQDWSINLLFTNKTTSASNKDISKTAATE